MLKRLMAMAFLGACGGVCGAAAGEALFLDLDAEQAPAAAAPRNICLVFDLSESMLKRTKEGDSQLEALRKASLDFVASSAFAPDALSLVGFADDARLVCPPTRAGGLREPIGTLRAGGVTDIARGLDLARKVLEPEADAQSFIVLFTDGKPQTSRRTDPVEETRVAAKACRDAGIHIVAVGTGLADRALLEEITGDPTDVFVSEPEKLGEAFRRSEERIQSRQMLASTAVAIDLEESLQRACGWAGLVGFGVGLALVLGHNRHLRRPTLLRPTQALLVLLGAAFSGLAAGAAGQGLFYLLSGAGVFEPVLRTVAWVLLGSGVVLGMSFFVPNLPRGRALVGGALGGGAAVACFLRIVPVVGDTPGRLLGAAILGLMAGAMTVLVEASVRKAWLLVRWPRGETTTLLLGATPVVVGHSAKAHICPSFDESLPAVLGVFTHLDQATHYADERTGSRRRLRSGERMGFGPVVVEVHEEREERGEGERPAPAERTGPSGSRSQPTPRAPLPQSKRGRTPA